MFIRTLLKIYLLEEALVSQLGPISHGFNWLKQVASHSTESFFPLSSNRG
jgi:hypothetical protein